MNEERLALIVAAIKSLKPEDFTKSGAPNLAALKTTIPDITAEERDTVWATLAPATSSQEAASENTTAFDTEGATPIVTFRDGGPKRVWFRDGKEIGSEDV